MDIKEEETEQEKIENVSLKTLVKYAAAIFALMGGLATGFNWLDDRYVNEDMYEQHIKDIQSLEEKTAKLIELIEEDREKDKNEVLKAVKDAQAFPLMVRRDILTSRETLSPQEKAELEVLNLKLRELNIPPSD
jgi:hypothetical protein